MTNFRLTVLLLGFLLIAGCNRGGEVNPTPEILPTSTGTSIPATPTEIPPEPTSEPVDTLHVPSPAWEDQIIYFLMTDRFNDGDPANNDQGMGEYDPQDGARYQGGDFAGVIEQLDYIQGLGATTIWITPPVANQWWDPLVNYGGYHGYWAENFKEVDRHLGDLAAYQDLSRALHARGMYLIQDVVVNHTGNFFSYDGPFDPSDPLTNLIFNTLSVPVTAPSQPPFNLNDPSNPEHIEADIYHWTPSITDFSNPIERQIYQLADLDDLDTKNETVRDALRDSFGYWIEEAGVDGFRIDTIIYVEPEFWEDFLYADDPDAPGVELAAAATGRDDFLTYGEAFLGADPMDNTRDLELAAFTNSADHPGMDAVINFPLYFDMNRVFTGGQPTQYLTFRVASAMDSYPNPFIIPNFLDNHDVARYLTSGSTASLEQALAFLMTVPGIPVIYYGTEQGFRETRASMFAEGVGSGGQDHFDTTATLYGQIGRLAEIRRSSPVFTRGGFQPLMDTAEGPGILAYSREYEGETAIILLNTSDSAILLAGLDAGLPAGSVLTNLFGIHETEDIVVGAGGLITREIAAREALILWVSGEVEAVEAFETTLTLDTEIDGLVLSQDTVVSGTFSMPETAVKILIDGNAGTAIETTTDSAGLWSVILPLNRFPPGTTEHTLQIYIPAAGFVSDTYEFTAMAAAFDVQVSLEDPAGDDKGPDGAYVLPTDTTFGSQMDILGMSLEAPGPDLIVTLTMAELTDGWGPVHGFDHVMFHVFIDFPNQAGSAVLPRINALAPPDFQWDTMAFIEGWNSLIYSAAGASATEYGTPVSPAPLISVDNENGTITITFPGAALGNPAGYEGVQVYITTWDWDGPAGAYRGLDAAAGQWSFGGGAAGDPLIADSIGPLVLSEE